MMYHLVAPTNFIVLMMCRLAYMARRMVLFSSSSDMTSSTARNITSERLICRTVLCIDSMTSTGGTATYSTPSTAPIRSASASIVSDDASSAERVTSW